MRKIQDNLYRILIKQGHNELNSSFLYLQASYWASSKLFPGTAAFFRAESQSEMSHALQFFDYIEKRGNLVQLEGVHKTDITWEKPVDLFKTYLDTEVTNSKYINDLAIQAQQLHDWNTITFLKSFLDNQLHDSSKAEQILAKAKAYSENPSLFYEFDKEVGSMAGGTAAKPQV